MIEIQIEQTNNRNLEDFVVIEDIIENENGVIDITVKSSRFKYWEIGNQNGDGVQINSMVHYEKGTLFTECDWCDSDKDLEFETFCFTIIFDDEKKNEWCYYEVMITPLKWQYEIKLIPQKLISTYKGKELSWEETVFVDEEEMKNDL
jgi:hypothetical protein